MVTVKTYINDSMADSDSNIGYIKLQRAQFGNVANVWDFNIVNGQHGQGIYAFKYGIKPMIDYYTKNGENLYTFRIPKKYLIDLSNKNWDYWELKAFIYSNPQYKAFMLKHRGHGLPTSQEILITDPDIIELIIK